MRRLIYDPNALHIRSLKKQTRSTAASARALLQRIVGTELAQAVSNYSEPSAVPSSAYDENLRRHLDDCGTAVFFWGTRRSGKTSVVGALLALPEVQIDKRKNNASMLSRANALASAFAPNAGGYRSLGETEDYPQSEVTFATLRHREGATMRRFKVAFVEADLTDALPEGILDAATEQLHIFCIDPTADVDAQALMAADRLKELETKGYIQHKTAGVYVLVTKVDTMYRVPLGYRIRAAQTMITIRCRSLWQKIRNICYDKGIFGASPIAFSIGEVKFQALARVTDDFSRRLLLTPLVQKCRPEPTLLERIMRLGGKRLTTTLALLFAAAMLYGLYSYLRIDTPVPEQGNAPYKFMPDFRARLSEMASADDFTSAALQYDLLDDDLTTEHTILFFTSEGEQPLLPADSFNICRTQLDSTMAAIVDAKVEREMCSSSWNAAILSDCQRYADRLKGKNYLSLGMRQKLTNHSDHISTYRNILSLLRNTACSSVGEVEDKIRRAAEYDKLPYTNNYDVRQGLADVSTEAVSSCARKYLAEAERLRREWKMLDDRNPWYKVSEWFSNDSQRRVEKAMKTLRDNLCQLQEVAHQHNVSSADDTIASALDLLPQ